MKLAQELPVPIETAIPQLLEAGLDNDQLYGLVRVNEAFLQALTGLLLDVTFARIGLEGGNRKVDLAESEAVGEKSVASERALPPESPARQAGTPTRAA